MARPLRVEFPGAWFHVTACGNERRAIFGSDMDEGHRLQLVGDRRESSICACGFLEWPTTSRWLNPPNRAQKKCVE